MTGFFAFYSHQKKYQPKYCISRADFRLIRGDVSTILALSRKASQSRFFVAQLNNVREKNAYSWFFPKKITPKHKPFPKSSPQFSISPCMKHFLKGAIQIIRDTLGPPPPSVTWTFFCFLNSDLKASRRKKSSLRKQN